MISSGSPMQNWHSILRKGIINASGTKFHGRDDFFQPNLPSQAGREALAELYGDETPISDVDGLSGQRRRISGSQATLLWKRIDGYGISREFVGDRELFRLE